VQELFPVRLERLLLPLLEYFRNKKEMLRFYDDENHRKLWNKLMFSVFRFGQFTANKALEHA